MPKQCRTLNESQNMRCLKDALPASRYCYRHYPKRGMIYSLMAGMALGVILVFLIHFSPDRFLERYPVFYYLDRTPPQLKSLSPDVRRFKYVDRDLRVFQLQPAEGGSGVDWTRSRIELKRDLGGKTEIVPGKSAPYGGMLRFEAPAPLEEGNYFIEALLVDRAGHEIQIVDSFMAASGDLGVSVRRHPLYKDAAPETFQELTDLSAIAPEELMVYRIDVFHQAPQAAVLKNVKIQTEFPGPVLAMFEIGSSGTDREDPFPVTGKKFWKQKKFTDRKWIEIGQLDAHGMIAFAVLVKCSADRAVFHQALSFSGTYDYQSYQNSGTRHAGFWVPVKEESQ